MRCPSQVSPIQSAMLPSHVLKNIKNIIHSIIMAQESNLHPFLVYYIPQTPNSKPKTPNPNPKPQTIDRKPQKQNPKALTRKFYFC